MKTKDTLQFSFLLLITLCTVVACSTGCGKEQTAPPPPDLDEDDKDEILTIYGVTNKTTDTTVSER